MIPEGVNARSKCKSAGCPRLNVLAGIAPPGVAREKLMETLIGTCSIPLASQSAGLTLLTEPCNTAPSRASSQYL